MWQNPLCGRDTFKNQLPKREPLVCVSSLDWQEASLLASSIEMSFFCPAQGLCAYVWLIQIMPPRHVALEVTYVILCMLLKITYPSAACHLTCPYRRQPGRPCQPANTTWQRWTPGAQQIDWLPSALGAEMPCYPETVQTLSRPAEIA